MSDEITDEMAEATAVELWRADGATRWGANCRLWEAVGDHAKNRWRARARDIIAAVAPLIRAQEREACAKVADYGVARASRDWRVQEKADGAEEMAREIADAIRARGETK